MIKVLQFGEGNFLRAFVDHYFDERNRQGGDYHVTVVKPRPGGDLSRFAVQENAYHLVIRGAEKGERLETIHRISVLRDVFSPFSEPDRFFALARDPELRLVVSNTTEAGIVFEANDRFADFDTMTFPGRLTRFLYERFQAGLAGVYLLPTELIDHNADELFCCVDRYISLWDLPETFRAWNEGENYYCNTLVDRIVSGYPKTEEDVVALTKKLGEPDALLTVAEPFGLWAVENKGDLSHDLPAGRYGIDLLLTDDVDFYKKRKVRVLNGAHTALTPVGLLAGARTVFDCMADKALSRYLDGALAEILPFVSEDPVGNAAFAESVKERFRNPFLGHQLSGILLNSISKWRARVLPTFRDYYASHRKIPSHLALGFAALMKLYAGAREEGGAYRTDTPSGAIALSDEPAYLAYFAAGGSIFDFMADERAWGEDLGAYEGFVEAVERDLARLERGEWWQ